MDTLKSCTVRETAHFVLCGISLCTEREVWQVAGPNALKDRTMQLFEECMEALWIQMNELSHLSVHFWLSLLLTTKRVSSQVA